MHALVVAEVQREFAVEVSLGDVELNVVHVRALILANAVNIELALTGVNVALVGQNVGVDLPLVVNGDLGTLSNAGVEGQLLGGGIVGELAFRSGGILLKRGADSTDGLEDIELGDFSTGSADSFVTGSGLMVLVNGQEVIPHNFGVLRLKLRTGLHLNQTAGKHTIGTGNGHSLIPLHGAELTTLLTGDVNLFLTLGDGCALQLIEGEKIVTRGDVKSIDGLKAVDMISTMINSSSFVN